MKKSLVTTLSALMLLSIGAEAINVPVLAADDSSSSSTSSEQPNNNQPTDFISEEFTGRVNYVPGYGINLWKINDQGQLEGIKKIQHGTTYHVFGSATISGIKFYKLGENEWAEAQYIVDDIKVPAGPIMTADSFIGTINYVPGYGVNLWNIQNNQLVSANRKLAHGSRYKVYGYVYLNGMKLYNVGTNAWVPAQYLTSNVSTPQTNDTTPITNETVTVVGYVANYGIALFERNGDSFSPIAGRYLKNGTSWKVSGKTIVNGKTWYQVGGNQWVFGDNVVVATPKSLSAILNVPYVSQYTPIKAPWGCAAAALSMLLGFNGKTIDAAFLKQLQDNLPMQPTPGGQLGNVYTGKGFGYVINSSALTTYGQQWAPNLKDVSGASANTIKNLVLSGHPVLYYGWSSYQNLSADTNRNHCKVIVGYKDGKFLVHDPLYYSASAGYGQGGTKETGRNNGYDQGAIYWSTMDKFNREYNGHAITL